jgi:hypothetical protein
MGGAVAFATRFSNGEVGCMDVWTNPLPYLIKTKQVMLDRDEDAVRTHYKECREVMERDGTPMHEDAPLAPLGYGLVVLDFKANVLLSMQNYTGFDNFSELEACGHADDDKFESFLAFCEAGQIEMTRIDYDDAGENVISKLSSKIKDAEEGRAIAKLISDMIHKHWHRSDENARRLTWYRFKIVGNQFEQTRFEDHSSLGARQFRTKMKQLGFQFDRPAQRTWREWIKEMQEYEEENAEMA